jgi:Flp pilus assembly pilin Flp
MKKYLERIIKDESGQGLMAYGIGIFFVTFILIIVIGLINGDLVKIYTHLATQKR